MLIKIQLYHMCTQSFFQTDPLVGLEVPCLYRIKAPQAIAAETFINTFCIPIFCRTPRLQRKKQQWLHKRLFLKELLWKVTAKVRAMPVKARIRKMCPRGHQRRHQHILMVVWRMRSRSCKNRFKDYKRVSFVIIKL